MCAYIVNTEFCSCFQKAKLMPFSDLNILYIGNASHLSCMVNIVTHIPLENVIYKQPKILNILLNFTGRVCKAHTDGLEQNCSISITNVLVILHSCTKVSTRAFQCEVGQAWCSDPGNVLFSNPVYFNELLNIAYCETYSYLFIVTINSLVRGATLFLIPFLMENSPWVDIQADHRCCKEIRGVRILLDSYQLPSVNVYSHNYWRHLMLLLFRLSTFILRGSLNSLNGFQSAPFDFCGYFFLFCMGNIWVNDSSVDEDTVYYVLVIDGGMNWFHIRMP